MQSPQSENPRPIIPPPPQNPNPEPRLSGAGVFFAYLAAIFIFGLCFYLSAEVAVLIYDIIVSVSGTPPTFMIVDLIGGSLAGILCSLAPFTVFNRICDRKASTVPVLLFCALSIGFAIAFAAFYIGKGNLYILPFPILTLFINLALIQKTNSNYSN